MAFQVLALPDTGYHFLPSGISGCSLPQPSSHSMPNVPPACVRSLRMKSCAYHTFLADVAHVNDVPIHNQALPAHATSCQQQRLAS